ncbi:glycerol-3-phosphate acyltransferase [Caldibacillus debilis]|jgi:acyl-phosphate glycerol 3-phosphate acyltransferase|nr:glycerol-3-phosphate acyltransferase [Caldibacillus debilis]
MWEGENKMILLLTILCFLSGSLMFSYWLGLLKKKNITEVGDGNPGAANLWKAAGYKYGLTGIFLDFMKGYIPIVLIKEWEMAQNYQFIPIALAPIYGHAFSPFMKGRGGKSIAVSFGVWSGLTEFRASFMYAVILAVLAVITKWMKKGNPVTSEEDGFQTTLGMLFLYIYFYHQTYPAYIQWIWLGNFLLLFHKNKRGIILIIKNKRMKKEEKHYTV